MDRILPLAKPLRGATVTGTAAFPFSVTAVMMFLMDADDQVPKNLIFLRL